MRKLLACMIAVSLVFGSAMSQAVASEADAHGSSAAAYATDIAVNPCQDNCPHAGVADHQHPHDSKVCKKWCAACTIAGLSDPPAAGPARMVAGERLPMLETRMAARAVPIEPGIPKHL